MVVLVAWLGGKGNRAWWVGGGAILVSIGSALFTLPQWIGDKYVPSGTDVNDLGEFLLTSDILVTNNILKLKINHSSQL